MSGKINPIYIDWTSKGIPIKILTKFLSGWKSPIKSTKEEQLPKPPHRKMPTVPVMEVNEREEKKPCHTHLRWSAMARAGQNIQDI